MGLKDILVADSFVLAQGSVALSDSNIVVEKIMQF